MRSMDRALAVCHQDLHLYCNALERLATVEGHTDGERAEAVMVLFVAAGCSAGREFRFFPGIRSHCARAMNCIWRHRPFMSWSRAFQGWRSRARDAHAGQAPAKRVKARCSPSL